MNFKTFIEVLGDTCEDALKALPILLLAYLLITFFEHIKEENYVHKMRGNFTTVIFGSLLGIVPQCAFSAFSADMYSKKKIYIIIIHMLYVIALIK